MSQQLALPPTPGRRPAAHTETPVAPDVDRLTEVLPPYRVILHNDDHNAMDFVVLALKKSVPSLSTQQAVHIMLEAHHSGRATVITCPLEHAELYRDRLLSFGLTATIEKA